MIKNHINDKKNSQYNKDTLHTIYRQKKPKIISKNIKCGVLTV